MMASWMPNLHEVDALEVDITKLRVNDHRSGWCHPRNNTIRVDEVNHSFLSRDALTTRNAGTIMEDRSFRDPSGCHAGCFLYPEGELFCRRRTTVILHTIHELQWFVAMQGTNHRAVQITLCILIHIQPKTGLEARPPPPNPWEKRHRGRTSSASGYRSY